MFGMGPIPTTPPQQVREWNVTQQPDTASLLEEVRQTNALLKGILARLTNGADPGTKSPDALCIPERVAWLERQIAELKERR